MKVILLKDIKGVGRKHDTVEMADGHALNYLIPKHFAVPATAAAQKEATLRQKQSADRAALDAALLAKNLSTLAEARIVIKAKANEKGHLYDAIGETELRKAVKEQAHVDLADEVIRLEKPIKEVGTFDIPVSAAGAFGKFSVIVEAA